jgi:hypothetical protein
MHLLTFIRILHLLGLVMGFGGALLLDGTIFMRGVIRPVSRYTIHQAELLSRVVTWGLILLWTTGFALIWLNLLEKPDYLTNQKLWAKIIIVVLLTLNGVFIHNKVMPMLKQRLGQRLFVRVSRAQLAALTLIGSISFVSWTMPFILGKASELNYVTPMWFILSIYASALAATWIGLFALMGSIAAIQRAFAKIAAKTMQASESWENGEIASVNTLRPVAPKMRRAMGSSLEPAKEYAE